MSKLSSSIMAFLLFACVGFAEQPPELGRPQDPEPPFPYFEEEVVFENELDGVTLAGTLTLPGGGEPGPAVILVHGSGEADRDCAFFGHRLFLVLADHLTTHGLAVLRFDKRGVGQSTGDLDSSTLEDFARDVLAGVEYLKTREDIDPSQIGLLGYSEGGMTAPLAASQSVDIAFLVLLAAPAVNWEELLYTQVTRLQRADGIPEEAIQLTLQLLQHIFMVLKAQPDRELAALQLQAMFDMVMKDLPPAHQRIIENYYGSLENQIDMFNSEWFRFGLTYEPAEILKKITVPVMAIHGDLDAQVSSEQNLPVIVAALHEGGNFDYEVTQIRGINHALQECRTGSMREYSEIDETIAPIVLDLVTSWILERVRIPEAA